MAAAQDAEPLPLNVVCPRCKAAVDWPCKRPSGAVSPTHRERWKEVGVVAPATSDLMKDWRDQDKRAAQRLRPKLLAQRPKLGNE